MAATLQEIIQRLSRRCAELEERYMVLLGENSELKAENARMASEIERLRSDNDFLIVSHKLASDPDELVRTRRRIAGLIGDIDKCISQLKE